MKLRIGIVICAVAVVALAGCERQKPHPNASVLLFNGRGASPGDVRAVEGILRVRGLEYTTADSDQLNAMSESDLANYRLLVVPGGNYLTMGENLTAAAARRVHRSVEHGVNYLGICAGGLLAGKTQRNSFDLTSGVKFGFFSAVDQGIHKAAVKVVRFNEPTIEHYWEDGPEFTGWGTVVGKYPDGKPAIVENWCGKGWVILCGVHPEAPESWRRGLNFATPGSAAVANDYAGALVDAAFNGAMLPSF